MDIVYSNNKKVLNSVTGISGQFIVPESVEKLTNTLIIS